MASTLERKAIIGEVTFLDPKAGSTKGHDSSFFCFVWLMLYEEYPCSAGQARDSHGLREHGRGTNAPLVAGRELHVAAFAVAALGKSGLQGRFSECKCTVDVSGWNFTRNFDRMM